MKNPLIADHTKNNNLKDLLSENEWIGTPVDKKGRFLNVNFHFEPSLVDVVKWKAGNNKYKDQKKQEVWNPEIDDDLKWLSSNEDCLVWLGHSSFYCRINGVNMLIDPVFGDILTVKRKTRFPVDPVLFQNIAFVLISHDHRDHMDEASLKLIQLSNPDVMYLAGLNNESLIRKFTNSSRIETAGWYQQFSNQQFDIKFSFLPSRHWSKRGVFDANERLWGAFVIQTNDKQIYFGGDSGYDDHYSKAGEIFGKFDFCMLGIGAYEPQWFMSANHQSPAEAFRACKDLNAEFMIPMHYGTFDLSDEPLGNPIQQLSNEPEELGTVVGLTIGRPWWFSRAY